MDSHIAPGLTARDIAEAHYKDTLIQADFKCRCMTYWYDEGEGYVFCLIDAPNKEAVIEMHSKSHGLVPNEIIQVDHSIVESFLGRIRDPEHRSQGQLLNVFTEKAYRILVALHVEDVKLLRHRCGPDGAAKKLDHFYQQVLRCAAVYQSRKLQTPEGALIFPFSAAADAYRFASELVEAVSSDVDSLNLKICVNGGMPVDETTDMFGETILVARAMKWVKGGTIIIAGNVSHQLDASVILNEHTRSLNQAEHGFLKQLALTLEKSFADTSFGIPVFCDMMSMSKPQLYRKCVAVTGSSPNSLLRDFRLQKALKLLREEGLNITETAFDSGFASSSYFAKCFQQKYGLQPVAYLKA